MTWHRWLSEDEYLRCLICGGLWTTDDGHPDGDPVALNGDPASNCTGDTSQCHGVPDEYGDEPDDPRYRDDCNCLSCR